MRGLKVVYSNALGWRVQAGMVKKAASTRGEAIGVELIPYQTPKLARVLLKDTYGISFPKRLNLITSIAVAKSFLCKDMAHIEADDHVVFMGANSLGLLEHAPPTVSPVVVTDITAALAARMFGAKFTRRDFAEEARYLSRCRRIFAMSSACASSLVDDYHIAADMIDLYLPAVHLAPARTNAGKAKLRIGFVGGDFKRKGGDLLLEAFRSSGLSRICELVIVSEKCEPLQDPGITVHGRLSHDVITNEILPSLDIFCLPTLQDCSGVAIAEALSAGVPVIATDLPSLTDLVVHGETGLVVPAQSAPAIGQAIMALADDSALRERMSRRARDYAAENFSMDRKLSQLLAPFG